MPYWKPQYITKAICIKNCITIVVVVSDTPPLHHRYCARSKMYPYLDMLESQSESQKHTEMCTKYILYLPFKTEISYNAKLISQSTSCVFLERVLVLLKSYSQSDPLKYLCCSFCEKPRTWTSAISSPFFAPKKFRTSVGNWALVYCVIL